MSSQYVAASAHRHPDLPPFLHMYMKKHRIASHPIPAQRVWMHHNAESADCYRVVNTCAGAGL